MSWYELMILFLNILMNVGTFSYRRKCWTGVHDWTFRLGDSKDIWSSELVFFWLHGFWLVPKRLNGVSSWNILSPLPFSPFPPLLSPAHAIERERGKRSRSEKPWSKVYWTPENASDSNSDACEKISKWTAVLERDVLPGAFPTSVSTSWDSWDSQDDIPGTRDGNCSLSARLTSG